jgi:oligoendopeptidase F
MMATATPTAAPRQSSSADGVVWELRDLYRSINDPRINEDLQTARDAAQAFETAYRGRIAVEGGPAPDFLATALQQLEHLAERMDRPAIYAGLVHAARSDDPRHGALLAHTREQRTEINKHLIFFDLEWVQLDDAAAARLIKSPVLARYRHYLEQRRAMKPHYLSEPEEKILDQKTTTGRAAFVRLFDETVAAMAFPYEHGGSVTELSQQQILAKLYDADRSVRKAAADGLTKGLQQHARLITYIENNLVMDHRGDCDLRRFDRPEAPRHLANEIDHRVVEALMTATERHHGMVQRYYRLKAKLLGMDQLYDYDRYAPLFADMPKCQWSEARRIVESSYEAFSSKAGAIIKEFFDRNWIDAELRFGKRGGAFSSSAVPSVHPYILMNYTDKLRDIMTLAHELGHGLHQYLARPVGYLQCDTPLTTAETASVFGEMLTFQQLLQLYPEPRIRLGMLCSKIEDGFATVFRQVLLTRFEQSMHDARRNEGELTTERINELWLAANRPMHGDVVQLTEGYGWWWMYIGHFVHVPFYCYAYAFGELLVLALYQKYKQEGAKFVPRYLDLLASGASDAPHKLLAKLDIDVTDPSFWELGLHLLDKMVQEAEELANQM